MFDKTMARGFLAVACLATMLAGPATAAVVLPTGLPPGSEYEIAFVTTDGTAGASSNIADYNNFVTAEANQDATLSSLDVSWNAIASTFTVSASANAPNNGSIPVYNTHGNLVASLEDPLYSGVLLSGIGYDQFGSSTGYGLVWTGSLQDGASFAALGGNEINVGTPGWTTSGWLNRTTYPVGIDLPLYSLSSPITVAPEPTALALLGATVPGIGALYLLRRRPAMRRAASLAAREVAGR